MDGNKRTAVYLVELLALRSGYQLAVEDLVLADLMTDVARGQMGYEGLAAWFEERLERIANAQPDVPAPRTETDGDQ